MCSLIFTLGTSTRSLGEFVEILEKFKVGIVVDVRHFPTSKRYPWFCRENLEEELGRK